MANQTDQANPELEAAIEADLGNDSAWLVFADWLQQHGDPRGELITLEHGGKQAQAEALLARHRAAWLGDALAGVDGDTLALTWKHGFVRSARIAIGYDTKHKQAEVLGQLLATRAARFLEELTFGVAESAYDGENNYRSVIDVLAERGPRSLRTLFIGDFTSEESEVSWSSIGDVSPLWARFPRLTSMILHSGSMTLGKIVAPALRSFEVRTGGLDADSIAQIGAATWPNLERLSIWFGSSQYNAEGTVDSIQPILDGVNLPKLKHLGLMNSEFADDLCGVLHRAKILRQLESLDLSMGTMTSAGARALAEHKAAYAHLTSLDVTDNYLGDEGLAAVKGLCAKVDVSGQRGADDEDRYVSVGE